MKRVAFLIAIVGLAAAVVGCQPPAESPSSPTTSAAADGSSNLTLVTLKVPNMT